ncbi:GTPase IMAP family member 4 [Patella vulgata]|uniref:GTPase IMAP family member 4 n=1 Tax=Patella vulgata TaxID=6465 RepID=UPI00217F84BF|nr:GTPase IMAP family member 4 [Patella vulgata]XP_055956723.1 GTPase IMAP family member 4 [Patella vulgata]
MVDMAMQLKGTSISEGVQRQLDLLESLRRIPEEDVQELQQQEKDIRGEHVSTARKLFNKVLGESIEEKIKRLDRELKESLAQKRRTKELQIHGNTILGPNGDVRVALVGKTGIGKSHLGSNLLKTKVFKFIMSFMSVTKQCKFEERRLDDTTTLLVVDTPGLFDTRDPNEQTSREIVRSIALAAPGPHIYIFVLSVGRFTPEEADTVNILQEMFGKEVIKHVIVVFTRKDELADNNSRKQFILKSPPVLQNLLEQCGYRFAFINNKADQDELREDVDVILDIIYKTIGENNGAYYTNDMYKKADAVLEVRRKEIRSERERKQTELRQQRDQIFKEAEKKDFYSTDGMQLLKDTREAENMLEEKRRQIEEIEEKNKLLTLKLQEEKRRQSILEDKIKFREEEAAKRQALQLEENRLRDLEEKQRRLVEEDLIRRQEMQREQERLNRLAEQTQKIVDEDEDSSLRKTLQKLTEINEKMVENAQINPNRKAKKDAETDDKLLEVIGSAVIQVGSAAAASVLGVGAAAVSTAVGVGSAAVGWLKSWWSK